MLLLLLYIHMKTDSRNIQHPTAKPEINQKLIENIRKVGQNRNCFDCGEKVNLVLIKNFKEHIIRSLGNRNFHLP